VKEIEQAAREGLGIARRAGEVWWEGRFLQWLAMALVMQRQYVEARRLAQDCLKIAEETGDLWLRACVCSLSFGDSAYVLGDVAEATTLYRQALSLFEESGTPGGLGKAHRDLGNVALSVQNYTEAENSYRQSLKIFKESGQRFETLKTLVGV